MSRLALAVLFVVLAASAPAAADSSDHTQRLADAQDKLLTGEYALAASLAGPMAGDATLERPLRAEANRIYGLALFLLGLHTEAEPALLAYLKLEPDAHLDPALVPPEAIVFFEDVRARHAGELIRRKPRARTKKSWALSLLPPFGQFQNGDTAKGWIVAATGVALLTANVTTFFLLQSNCSTDDHACDDPERARTLQTINITSGVALIALYIYGVADGYLGYRQAKREEATGIQLGAGATPDGGAAVWIQGSW